MKPAISCLLILLLASCNAPNRNQEIQDSLSTDSFDRIAPKPKADQEYDSLSKYSYRLQLFKQGIGDGIATCFFIKKNGHLIALSNYHVFANVSTADRTKRSGAEQYDSMHIIFIDSLTKQRVYKSIDLRKISAESPPVYFYEKPDVYAYDIGKSIPNVHIHSIESFLTKLPSSNDSTVTAIAFGFPQENGQVDKSTLKLFKTVNSTYVNREMLYGPERIHAVLDDCYLVTPRGAQGMSGAPVFLHTSYGIVFGGLVSTELREGFEIIVKPQAVLKYLKSKKLF